MGGVGDVEGEFEVEPVVLAVGGVGLRVLPPTFTVDVAANLAFGVPVILLQMQAIQGHDTQGRLGEIRQRGGKRVIAFCGEGEFDTARMAGNTFEIEWPPRSGHLQSFPEVDRAEWFDLEGAKAKILPGQVEFLERLEKLGP